MNVFIIVLSAVLGVSVILLLLVNGYLHWMKSLKLLATIDESKEVVIEKDLEYKKRDQQSLRMDVYRPGNGNREGKIPAIIFLHGEGVERMLKNIKDWGIYTGYGRLATCNGFAGVTFHRSRTNLNFNHGEVARDIADAVDFVRKNADRWGIDENRICLWAFSLGGLYLSLFLRDLPKYIRCLISYYGLLDVKYRVKKTGEANQNYQPENYLPENGEGFPPLLIVKAGKDRVKGVNASQDHFVEIARKRRIPFEMLIHKTGRHSFDILDDNDETRDIMAQTWEFIKRNL